jgi:magnesium-protoporphyrin IX monomethyl ester (oxidative) cyclase
MRCLKFNVKPEWNLLVGFPGETEAVYRKYLKDLPKLVHLPPPSGVWPVRFDRYSPYFVQAEQYKLRLEPLDYYKLIYPFPEESLGSLAYYFQDRNIEADYMQLVGVWLPELRTPVEEWVARWSNPDAAPPQLRLADDGETVLDSRSGVLVRNKLDERERWLLAELAQPRRKGELDSAAIRVFVRNITGPLESLTVMGLIFEEGDRLLSLVERTAAVGARPARSLAGASG